MSRVFVTLPLPSPGIDMLKERFEVTMMEAEGMPPETLKQHVAEADPVGIVGMVNVPITDDIMGAAPHLRVVANYAVGYNNVDVPAATRRGVLVTNTPGVLTDATADLAFALILAVARRVVEADRFLREGKFKGWKADLLLGTDVYGSALGRIDMLKPRPWRGVAWVSTCRSSIRTRAGRALRWSPNCVPSTSRSMSCCAKPTTSPFMPT